ncbi:MAG TPA: DUF559 domain-containing protein [Microlunatus sp.]
MPAKRTVLPASLRTRPFTYEEALAVGISRRALQGPSVRRLRRRVYVAAGLPVTFAVKVAAARCVLPADAVAAGVTALRLMGLELGTVGPLRFVSTWPVQRRQPGVLVSRVARLPPNERGRLRAEPAFLSAATQLDLVDLVAAGDWLVKQRRTTPAALRDHVSEARGRGSALARRAAGLVRERVDSVRETRLRLVLVLAGLPEPECNISLGSEQWFIGKVDLVYQEYRVLLEYEGSQHQEDRKQWNADIGRYEEFTAEGYAVIRVSSERMRYPRLLVNGVYATLKERGYDGPPPDFNAEWCTLFT